ncbi:hypothetical protein [Brachybacterium aquaticum]|uniref:Uncharacterized protein n=1 Tax=Brachybacterium aquaticum TaxID=1432564 RepID=A0A841AE76_9MICO|nr:hypothetical protein [Brachybacterium aquaticum]MBB5832253.1 hypothetical protein [Brachybacterium aquaticum]
MRLAHLVDPLAERLLVLRTVSGTQWLLRLTGATTSIAALLLTLGPGASWHLGSALVTLCVALAVLLQLRHPDSDLALIGPLATLVGLATLGDPSVPRAAGTGLLLLLAHSASALAATLPPHGRFEGSAWRLAGRGMVAVLALTVLLGGLVLLLAGVQLGAWAMVLGTLAAIGLLIAVLPRTPGGPVGRP